MRVLHAERSSAIQTQFSTLSGGPPFCSRRIEPFLKSAQPISATLASRAPSATNERRAVQRIRVSSGKSTLQSIPPNNVQIPAQPIQILGAKPAFHGTSGTNIQISTQPMQATNAKPVFQSAPVVRDKSIPQGLRTAKLIQRQTVFLSPSIVIKEQVQPLIDYDIVQSDLIKENIQSVPAREYIVNGLPHTAAASDNTQSTPSREYVQSAKEFFQPAVTMVYAQPVFSTIYARPVLSVNCVQPTFAREFVQFAHPVNYVQPVLTRQFVQSAIPFGYIQPAHSLTDSAVIQPVPLHIVRSS